MVIDLPFEGRKVEGSRKYRGRERVPKVGSRREETITEPINSRIGSCTSCCFRIQFVFVVLLSYTVRVRHVAFVMFVLGFCECHVSRVVRATFLVVRAIFLVVRVLSCVLRSQFLYSSYGVRLLPS